MSDAEDRVLERLKLWRDDYSAFALDCLKIQAEDTTVVPFRFNHMQRYFWKLEQDCWEKKVPFWVLVLKERRAGSSLYWALRQLWRALLNPNRNTMLRAHDDRTTEILFNMVKFSFKNLPELLSRTMVKLDNREIVHFANPDPKGVLGLESRMFASTVGGAHIGAGFGIHDLLLAELGRYDDVTDVAAMMTTIMQTIPFDYRFSVIGESTAHGEGSFKAMWENEDNGFIKEFISYVAKESYRLYVDDKFELSGIEDSKYGNEEEEAELVRKEVLRWYSEWNDGEHSSDIEQEVYCRLAWRRMRIDRYCQGDKRIFDQEFPITAERAFMLSGKSVFDTERLYIWIKELKETPPECKRYRFDTTYDFTEYKGDPRELFGMVMNESGFGQLHIYEPPIPGVGYGLGADPSLGVKDGDDAAITILRVPDRLEVAHWARPCDPDLFGDLIYVLARYYNNALVGIEMNDGGGGGTTLARLLRVLKYSASKIYRDKIWDRTKIDRDKRYGWQNNSRSKERLIHDYAAIIRDENIHFNSVENVKEHKAYKYFPDEGKWEKAFVAGPHGGKLSANRVIATALASLMVTNYPIYMSVQETKPEKNSVKDWQTRYKTQWTDSSPTRHNVRIHQW